MTPAVLTEEEQLEQTRKQQEAQRKRVEHAHELREQVLRGRKRTAPIPADDDIFLSGARMRSAEYTFIPARYQRDSGGNVIGTTNRLVARFKEHTCDLQRMAEAFDWSNEEKEYVKAALRAHRDYGVHIFENSVPTRAPKPEFEFCYHVTMEDDESVVCGRPVEEGKTFCDQHQEFEGLAS